MGAAVKPVADPSIDPITGKKKVAPTTAPATGAQQQAQPAQPAQPAAPKPAAPAQVPGQPAAAQPAAPATPPRTYAPASPVQTSPPMPSGSAAATAQTAALGQLQAAQNAPDRQAMAMDTFERMRANEEPAYQQQIRQLGANAAKYGRIGAGLTTNELTSAELARQRTLDSTKAQLASDAAGQTLADRMALANQALSQYGAFSGADQASNELALKDRLGTGQLALDTELGRGGLEVNRGKLALDQSGQEADIRQKQAQLALDKELGLGTLDVNRTRAANDFTLGSGNLELDRTRVANQADQFGKTFGEEQLTNDRNFALDDRTAAALASLNGIDLTNSGDGTSAYNLPTIGGGAGANPIDLAPPAAQPVSRLNPSALSAPAVQNADPAAIEEYVRNGLATGQLDQRTADAMLAMARGGTQ